MTDVINGAAEMADGSPDRGARRGAPQEGLGTQGRSRKASFARRVAALGGISALLLSGVVLAGSYAALARFSSNVRRVAVAHLAAAPGSGRDSAGNGQIVLFTSQDTAGANAAGRKAAAPALIMLLHVSSNQQSAVVASIPATAVVRVPGHGATELGKTVTIGGPSLLVQTVEQVTHVRINHYAQLDFGQVANLVDTIGGVDLTLPRATMSYGLNFPAGDNHLSGTAATEYAWQPSLSEPERILRQQSLIRAAMGKISDGHLLTDPVAMFGVFSALAGMLTVDSDFTSGQLAALARELASMGSESGTFLTAPAFTIGRKVMLRTTACRNLWAAVRSGSVLALMAHSRAR